MKVIDTVSTMQDQADEWRRAGLIIACVPTMGYLHEGHLSLMREGKKRAEVVVSSLFVNPTQFGPKEDLSRYPRDFEGDCAKMEAAGVDCLFAPGAEEMYPPRYQTYVNVGNITQGLCGKDRPTHFRGVATVVAKLFNIMKPHLALFGEKDFQQLRVIQRMVSDLNMDIEIIGTPTVREPDGLAMSSRNAYLSAEERANAICLYRALCRSRDMAGQGQTGAALIIEEAKKLIEAAPGAEIQYIEVVDDETVEQVSKIEKTARMALAVKFGKTRLIDNMQLVPPIRQKSGNSQ